MAVTVDQVTDALRNVNHPAGKSDIVSLKMVKDIRVEGKKIHLVLAYQKANDPFAGSVKKAINKTIENVFGKDYQVEIEELVPEKHLAKEFESLKDVKNIIAIASGKGGVGKSTIAVNTAIAVAHTGAKVALLDADIYGPSGPKMFGAEDYKPTLVMEGEKELMTPLEKYGIKLMSVGFFVKPDEALIWRGPMATNALKQVISQTAWNALDYLFIDLPPGTGDIHLTMVQEMPVTGAVIVSTPQQLALVDVIKAISMFQNNNINVPILGLVENMAWFTPKELPENKYFIFGKNGCKELAEKTGLNFLGQVPIIQSICEDGDKGTPSAENPFSLEGKAFAELADKLISEVELRNAELPPTKKVQIKR
jgi:ATP-binding protein involved in chromosome partitioning